MLRRYLFVGRDALRWKLDGLSEYDLRRPLVPTGTNLLGLIKHVAIVTDEYFSEVFGRSSAIDAGPFDEDAEPNVDMWAAPDESLGDVLALWDAAWAHAEVTIDELGLDSPGRVSWWGDRADVTLQLIMVHMTSEVHRHAGHADLVREMIDGEAGLRQGGSNLPAVDAAFWAEYREHLQTTAELFRPPHSGADET